MSVVVPSHRGAHRLPALLEALAVQDLNGGWEVVVVVDGRADDTLALLVDWSGRLPLRVLVNDEAQGAAAALTRGFQASLGEYLVRCDDDLTVPPDLLSRHVAAHAGRTDRAVLSLTRDVFPDTPYARAYGRPANERALDAYYAEPPETRWMHLAACHSLHRRAWEASGGFDPGFAYGEDFELG